MKKSLQKGKRTVPIRYNQNEFEKYKSSEKKSIGKKQSMQLHNDSQQIHDINDDQHHQSSHEYIKSSYLHNQSYEQEESNGNQKYEDKESDEEEMDLGDESAENHKSQFIHEIKNRGNPYELTFKKELLNGNQNSFSYYDQDLNQPQHLHEHSNQNPLSSSSESFQQILFPDQSSQTHPLFNPNQTNSSQSLLQTREKLFQKYHSALVSFHYFHAKQSKTIEQKHKEYLLQLLVVQLQKNIFVNGLKCNFILRKQKKKQQEKKHQMKTSNKRPQIPQVKNAIASPKSCQLKKTSNPKHLADKNQNHQPLNESLLEELQPKIVIFQQITYGVVKRKMFDCFSALLTKSQLLIRHKSDSSDDHDGITSDYDQQDQGQLYDSQEEQVGSEQSLRMNDYGKKLSVIKKPTRKRELASSKYQVSESRHSQPYKNVSHKQSGRSQQRKESFQSQQQPSHNFSSNQQKNQISHYDQQQQEYEQKDSQDQEEDQQLKKMQQLISYIESLKRQALQTDSQLKRYFTKWKIYMLEEILEEYHRQQQYDDRDEEGQQRDSEEQFDQQHYGRESDQGQSETLQQNYDMHTENQHQPEQLINVYHNHNHAKTPVQSLTDRQNSQKSSTKQKPHPISQHHKHSPQAEQHQDQLKQKLFILKSFLSQRYVNEFWDCFNQNYTAKKLMFASEKLREQNLKRNVLYGLKINIEWKQKQRAMDQYYQEIAQDQDLTEYRAAQLNHRTNLKAKYFFQLTKTCRNLKWIKKLDKLTLKFAFYKIYFLNESKKRKQQNIHRHFLFQKSKTLFKSFQAWKTSTILSTPFQQLKSYCSKKDKQLLGHYFSLFQILYKQSILKQRKAANYHKSQKLNKIFKYLRFLADESKEFRHKEHELKEYLVFSQGQQFYNNFYEFYGERILQHRLNIKAEKLWYSRQKELVYERLQDWRNYLIKKQSYQAIEYRLVKLREKQVKGRVMDLWIQQFEKRMGKKDELEQSAQHKDWLVKYYGSLCQIATSGKHRDRNE